MCSEISTVTTCLSRATVSTVFYARPCNSIERSKPVVTYTKHDFSTVVTFTDFVLCFFSLFLFSFIFISFFIFRSSSFCILGYAVNPAYVRQAISNREYFKKYTEWRRNVKKKRYSVSRSMILTAAGISKRLSDWKSFSFFVTI